MGDQKSWFEQYGGMIMMHSPGDNSLRGRFSNIELQHMGKYTQILTRNGGIAKSLPQKTNVFFGAYFF